MLLKILRQYFGISSSDKIMFFGSGKVAYPSAVKLSQNFSNLHYITHYSNGKKKLINQIQIFCKQKQLQYSCPIKQKKDKFIRQKQWKQFIQQQLAPPDFGIVCSFGYMLPKALIQLFTKGVVVVHPSLLPKYRGGSPIYHAIANGQLQTGVSYIEISPGKFDHGNLLLQKKLPLSQSAKYQQIQSQLANFCAQNLLQVINNIDSLRPGVSQETLLLSQQQKWKELAPIIKEKFLNLNQPAQKIYNVYRAMSIPRVKFQDKQIILSFQKRFYQDSDNKEVGTLKVKGKKLLVKCQDQFITVAGWRQPSRIQSHCGRFIAAYLRGKQQSSWSKFQQIKQVSSQSKHKK